MGQPSLPYTVNPSIIRIRPDIPLELSPNEVFFVEDGCDEATNVFIKNNYDLIADCFARRGYQFIYFPFLVEQLTADERLLRYRRPVGPLPEPLADSTFTGDWILDWMLYPENRHKVASPGFLSATDGAYDVVSFENARKREVQKMARVEFHVEECDNVSGCINYLIDELADLQRSRVLYHLSNRPRPADGRFEFDTLTKRLLNDVRKLLDELRARGISDHVLRQFLQTETPPSAMTITRDHRIILTDFDNMEITMTPLVKAVFFLFLRHPDGIMFKELADYRDELSMIYTCIKERRPLDEKITPLKYYDESILRLTNPLDNSINEKCARIKEAFLVHIHDEIARNYYVLGWRGLPKVITLDRDMVHWQ